MGRHDDDDSGTKQRPASDQDILKAKRKKNKKEKKLKGLQALSESDDTCNAKGSSQKVVVAYQPRHDHTFIIESPPREVAPNLQAEGDRSKQNEAGESSSQLFQKPPPLRKVVAPHCHDTTTEGLPTGVELEHAFHLNHAAYLLRDDPLWQLPGAVYVNVAAGVQTERYHTLLLPIHSVLVSLLLLGNEDNATVDSFDVSFMVVFARAMRLPLEGGGVILREQSWSNSRVARTAAVHGVAAQANPYARHMMRKLRAIGSFPIVRDETPSIPFPGMGAYGDSDGLIDTGADWCGPLLAMDTKRRLCHGHYPDLNTRLSTPELMTEHFESTWFGFVVSGQVRSVLSTLGRCTDVDARHGGGTTSTAAATCTGIVLPSRCMSLESLCTSLAMNNVFVVESLLDNTRFTMNLFTCSTSRRNEVMVCLFVAACMSGSLPMFRRVLRLLHQVDSSSSSSSSTSSVPPLGPELEISAAASLAAVQWLVSQVDDIVAAMNPVRAAILSGSVPVLLQLVDILPSSTWLDYFQGCWNIICSDTTAADVTPEMMKTLRTIHETRPGIADLMKTQLCLTEGGIVGLLRWCVAYDQLDSIPVLLDHPWMQLSTADRYETMGVVMENLLAFTPQHLSSILSSWLITGGESKGRSEEQKRLNEDERMASESFLGKRKDIHLRRMLAVWSAAHDVDPSAEVLHLILDALYSNNTSSTTAQLPRTARSSVTILGNVEDEEKEEADPISSVPVVGDIGHALTPKQQFIADVLNAPIDRDHNNALHLAARCGSGPKMQLLLQQPGVKVMLRGQSGFHALHFAASSGNVDAVEVMCRAIGAIGRTPKKVLHNGEDAAFYAPSHTRPLIAEVLHAKWKVKKDDRSPPPTGTNT